MSRILKATKHIATGYGQMIASILRLLLFVLVAVGASALVSFPIWYTATHHTRLFTYISLIALLTGVGILIGRSIIRAVSNSGSIGLYVKESVAPAAYTVVKTLIVIISLYGIAILFYNSLIGFALAAIVAFLAISGYFLYVRGTKKRS